MTKHDTEAIRHLIARQFNSMCWTPNNSADWKAFAADFAPWASLYPATRPAQPQTVERFVERMKDLAETTLHTFFEAPLGAVVHVFGNIAVAAAGCEMTEKRDTGKPWRRNDAAAERRRSMEGRCASMGHRKERWASHSE